MTAHVMVVDDNALQLKSQRAHFERAGYRVTTAASAEEALRAVAIDRPDAILSDIMMPVTDGFRLCRSLRRHPQAHSIPVVLVSGHYVDTDDLRHAAHCGASMFVPRALGPAAVVRGVGEALRHPGVRLDPVDDAALDAEHNTRLMRQVGRLQAQNEAVARAADKDPLTGLLTRAAFQRKLEQAAGLAQAGSSAAALVIGLRNFREINDALGSEGGDKVLREIAARLERLAGAAAGARLGAAQFGLLVRARDAVAVANAALATLAEPIVVDAIPVEMQPCIGWAQCPDDALLGSELLRRASVAVHHARVSQRNLVRYEAPQDPFSVEQLVLVAELRHAIARQELELWYQPKLDLAKGRIDAVEALLRWRHPQRGLVPPDDFIPLAESTGLMHQLTCWVLDAALAQCAQWRSEGLELNVSVNVSQIDLREPGFTRQVARSLADSGVPAGSLTLEITETAVMQDRARVVAVLGELRSLGVRISLDDFGTGHASLAHLHSLPVDELKLDKSFVLNLPDPHSRSIAGAAAMLAREFGLKSVAEGLESADSQRLLQQLGFGSVQGFHLSKPLPAEALRSWMAGQAGNFVQQAVKQAGPGL